MINHLWGGGCGAFIKEFHDSDVGHACSDCNNGVTIANYHERKLQPDSNVLRMHVVHIMSHPFSFRTTGRCRHTIAGSDIKLTVSCPLQNATSGKYADRKHFLQVFHPPMDHFQ